MQCYHFVSLIKRFKILCRIHISEGLCRVTCVLSPDPGDEKIAKNLKTNLHKPTVIKRAVNNKMEPEAERTQNGLHHLDPIKMKKPHTIFHKHCYNNRGPKVSFYTQCPHVTVLRPGL